MTITLHHYLLLSVLLFVIGMVGVLVRRNLIIIFMSIEMMLAAANIAVLGFARWTLLAQGSVIVIFVMAVMAAEAAVGLALCIAMWRLNGNILVDRMTVLRG